MNKQELADVINRIDEFIIEINKMRDRLGAEYCNRPESEINKPQIGDTWVDKEDREIKIVATYDDRNSVWGIIDDWMQLPDSFDTDKLIRLVFRPELKDGTPVREIESGVTGFADRRSDGLYIITLYSGDGIVRSRYDIEPLILVNP